MGIGKKLAAALGGLLVSFVLVALLQSVGPEPGLATDTASATLSGFQFEEPGMRMTDGTRVTVHNDDPVPVTLRITSPAGDNNTIRLGPGESRNVTLTGEGVHAVSGTEWSWVSAEWEVVSGNPFVRFWDRTF